MSDNEQFHYQFIHNVFGCFIENTLEYFGEYLYPRFQHKIVGTYDKAVQYIVNKERDGREVDKPTLPALVLNPSGDFNLDDANAGGKQFWRFPHLNPRLAQQIFDPIYIDKNVEITVAFTRLKGEFELLALLPSFYEFFDLKLFIIQMFGGEGRYISPMYFNDFIILPPDLVNYRYENDVTGESYLLDWKNNGAYEFLVKTTNKNELVIPGKVKPRYVLRGMSDGSTRYGGTDDIADWKLSTMIEYEIEIPSYLILRTNSIFENINFGIGYGSVYSTYSNYNIPTSEITLDVHINSKLKDKSNTIGVDGYDYNVVLEGKECGDKPIRREIVFKTRYFHQITEEQSTSINDLIIDLPEKIYDVSLIKVQGKKGLLIYGYNYIIEPTSDSLKIFIENTKLEKGEFIEIFIYEVPFNEINPISVFGASALISMINDPSNRSDLIVNHKFTGSSKIISDIKGVL